MRSCVHVVGSTRLAIASIMRWKQSSMCTATILLAMFIKVIAQSCSVNNIPRFRDFDEEHIERDKVQVIVPSYTFNCHGRVVQWGACVRDSQPYELELQVLRPLPVEQDDILCFSLVGTYSQRGRPDSPPHNIDRCIVIDIPPDDQIPVQPGDVVGFYSDNLDGSDDDGVQLDERRTDVTAFFRERDRIPPPSPSSCVFIAGPSNIDETTSAAPVITVVVEAVIPSSSLDPAHPLFTSLFHPRSTVVPSPTPPVEVPLPTPSALTVEPPTESVVPSIPDKSPTDPSATPPSGGGGSDGGGIMVVNGIVIAALLVIIIVLTVLVILFALRRKKQKTILKEQPQGAVLKSKEQYTMTRNDAYSTVITTERNEAYLTNFHDVPTAQNEAYGAVAAELEGGNPLDMNDAVYTECHSQTADDDSIVEYSYAMAY